MVSNDPVRERILAHLATTLRGIRREAGFFTDVKSVSRFRLNPFAVATLPHCSLYPVEDTSLRNEIPLYVRRLLVTVEAWLTAKEVETRIEYLLADIQRIVVIDPQRGGQARDTMLGDNRAIVAQGEPSLGGIEQDVLITYEFQHDDPREP